MKFFIDTANIEKIKIAADWGILDGVTTNPSLIAKEEIDSFESHIARICEIVKGPVSAEVTAMDYDNMVKQARELAKLSKYVVIKIPMTKDGIKAVKTLSGEGIKTNVTLIFSASQALLAAKAGATYVSPFLGRIDDISWESMDLLADIIEIYENYSYDTEIIAASIRHPMHVIQAAKMGCDIATVPFESLDKLFSHPLTDIGIEKFSDDWEKFQKRLGKE